MCPPSRLHARAPVPAAVLKSFTYSPSRTPTLSSVEPAVAHPGDAITLRGSRADGSLTLTSTDQVSVVTVGGLVCSLPDGGGAGGPANMGIDG